MIKRFIIGLISALCLFTTPSFANIKIAPETVDAAIREHFIDEKARASALATYKENVESNGSISAKAIWKVCTAGGLDIKQISDKMKCTKFLVSLAQTAQFDYYEVCGKDKGKSGKKEYCIDNFFTAKDWKETLTGTNQIQVTLTPAIELAKEYARLKHNDDSLRCSNNFRKGGDGIHSKDYGLKCTSQNKNAYYEFVFDDIEESMDSEIQNSILVSVCHLYGVPASLVNVNKICVTSDENLCKKISNTFARFGYSASYDNSIRKEGVCKVNFNSVSKAENLHTAYGIDPFVFCRGIQIQNAPSAESAIKKYIVSEAAKKGKQISEGEIECLAGFNTYTGPGCNVNGFTDFKDDIKTCKIGNEQIDFVFDDVNELWNSYHASGMQAMSCMTQDGIFDGENCVGLGEQQCNSLKAASLKDCPECKEIYWDNTKQVCVLPSAKYASNLQKGIKYGTLAVTVVAGTAITVASGGTAGAGVFVVVAKIGTGVMLAGAGGKLLAEGVKTWGLFQPFVDKAQKCILSGESQCAEDIVTKDLQKYMSYKKNFTQAEAKALDEIFAKLVERIPADSKFWDDFAKNPDLWDCTPDGQTCRIKEKLQFWQVLSGLSDALMIAGSLMRVVGTIGAQTMEKTTETIYRECNQKIMVKGGFNKGGQGIRVVSLEGAAEKGGTIIQNEALVRMGLAESAAKGANVNAARQLLANGAQLNTPFVHTWTEAVGTATNTVINNSLVPTINGAALAGGALTQAHQLVPGNDPNSFYITRPGANGGAVVVPGDNQQGGNGGNQGGDNQGGNGSQGGNGNQGGGAVVTPGGNNNQGGNGGNQGGDNQGGNGSQAGNGNQGGGAVVVPGDNQQGGNGGNQGGNNQGGNGYNQGGGYSVVSGNNNSGYTSDKPTEFTPDKQKNVGLIVGLTAAGLVATGAVVGGVVAATSKKKAAESASASTAVSQMDSEIENVMRSANGMLGTVNGKQISLIPLPTTVNTSAKLVEIDGFAVAVVGYNGYKLPYYIKSGRWTPLLGIGETGRWFNVYPKANTDIKTIDMITSLLNQQINPSIVMRYVGNNGSGVSLPVAAPGAFGIINAEFPNCVVQSQNMSPADAKLYSDNYNLIKRKLD